MIGQRIPDITFETRVKDEEGNYGWKDVTTWITSKVNR